MIGLVIDKKIETILTDKQLTNHSNDSQSLERKNSLERKYDSDQDRSIDQIINVEQNERKEQIKRDEDFRTFSDKNSDKSHKGNRTRFSEIEEKFERKRPNFTHSIQKRKDSNASEDYDTQPRKPTLPEIRKNTGSSRKETNPSYIMDQSRPLYSTLGKTPYFSVLSSLGLEEKDTDFIIKELSEYESMNKILHDNLKYQPAKYSPAYKKDKSLSIPKLYNVYLEKGSKQYTKKQIELNIRGSSPYLSGSKQKTPTNSQKLYYKPNYIKKERSSSHGIKPRLAETNLSSDDEYNVTKHNTTSFLHNKKPKMSIELGLNVHKGQTRPASNLRKPPTQVNSAPKSKRSESYTPNVSARRISRTYIENSHKVTPIVSNLLKTNPAKKRPQAPSRYMDYLNERKTSSTLLANRSMISRNSGRASKAELISKAVMLNEPLSKIKDNPKRLATPSRSMSKEKVDSGRFIREKYRIRTSAQNEASPSPDDSLNLTSGSIFANKNNTTIGSHIGEKKEPMGYISSLNKTGVTFPKSLRPSFAKIVDIPGPKYNLASYKAIQEGQRPLEIWRGSPDKQKSPSRSIQQSPERKARTPFSLHKFELGKIVQNVDKQPRSAQTNVRPVMTNDTTKLEITLVSEPNTQAGVLKRMNTPLPIENAIVTSEESHPSREQFNVVINELISKSPVQQINENSSQRIDTQNSSVMGINTKGEAQINAIEKEGFKLIVTQIK